MSTDSIEKLYKNFGVLADAKDKLSEVRTRRASHATSTHVHPTSARIFIRDLQGPRSVHSLLPSASTPPSPRHHPAVAPRRSNSLQLAPTRSNSLQPAPTPFILPIPYLALSNPIYLCGPLTRLRSQFYSTRASDAQLLSLTFPGTFYISASPSSW
jgi:hypothetical protein